MKKLFPCSLSSTPFAAAAPVKTPALPYPELSKAVQMSRVDVDGKTFPDVITLSNADRLTVACQVAVNKPGFHPSWFVHQFFKEPVGHYKSLKMTSTKTGVSRSAPFYGAVLTG